MFGRWLTLLRRGPDLLRATSLGPDPNFVESGTRDAQPARSSERLRSRDADARLRRREPAEEHARLIYDP